MNATARSLINRLARYYAFVIDSWHPYLFLSAAVLTLYLKTVSFGFTASDDISLIQKARQLIENRAIEGLFNQPLTDQFSFFFRPVLITSLITDTFLGNGSPLVYHATNIVLHGIASCVLLRILTALGYSRGNAFWASILFAMHPALTQSVAWISGRNDSLLAIGIFLSYYYLIRWGQTRRNRYAVLHVLALLAALLTKETGLAAFVLFIWYMFFVKPGDFSSSVRKIAVTGWLAVGMVWFGLRMIVRGLETAGLGKLLGDL